MITITYNIDKSIVDVIFRSRKLRKNLQLSIIPIDIPKVSVTVMTDKNVVEKLIVLFHFDDYINNHKLVYSIDDLEIYDDQIHGYISKIEMKLTDDIINILDSLRQDIQERIDKSDNYNEIVKLDYKDRQLELVQSIVDKEKNINYG